MTDRTKALGYFLLTSKKAWKACGGFRDGFKRVDLTYGEKIAESGKKCTRINSLYIYHGRYTNRLRGALTPDKLVQDMGVTDGGS